MTPAEITPTWVWIVRCIGAGFIGYGLGIISMQLLIMPKKPKKVKSSIEAALKTVQYHKDNDIAY